MRPSLAQLRQSGAVHGDMATWDAALDRWVPISLADLGVVGSPLFADDGSGPLLAEDSSDYIYANL